MKNAITSPTTRQALQVDDWTLVETAKDDGYALEQWSRFSLVVRGERTDGITLWKRDGGSLRVLGAFGDASVLAAFLNVVLSNDVVDDEAKDATQSVVRWKRHAIEAGKRLALGWRAYTIGTKQNEEGSK